MGENSEPITVELSKEFDRYMHIIDIIEKKAQNLIMVSSTFIAVLLGIIFIRISEQPPINLLYVFIPIGILFTVIIISMLAVRISGQQMPINVRTFFISRGIKGEISTMDTNLLKDIIINAKADHEISESDKEEYNKKIKEKTITIQKWLLESYLTAIHSAINNGTEKAKYVKTAEILLLSSIIIGTIMTAVLIVTSIINPQTTSS